MKISKTFSTSFLFGVWVSIVLGQAKPTAPVAKGLLEDEAIHRPWSFENDFGDWKALGCRKSLSTDLAHQGKTSLRLDVGFPLSATVYHEGKLHADRLSEIRFWVYFPETAPKQVKLLFYIKDKDGLYFQYLHRGKLERAKWQQIRVDVSDTSKDLDPHGHFMPWNRLIAARMNLFGVKFICDEDYAGPVYVDNIILKEAPPLTTKLRIVDLEEGQSEVKVFDKYELSFRLNRQFPNPFDSDQVRIDATFKSEVSGKVYVVPAFYFQDYVRSNKGRKKEPFRVEEANKDLLIERQEVLTPVGGPQWKVRFTPEGPGLHTFVVKVMTPREKLVTQQFRFTAIPSNGRGYVRISKTDPRYFEFDNGEFFYPIGHNVRSPFDERWWAVVLNQDWLPPDRGTYTYDQTLRKMKENGENFFEVWMSSWWLAIEWNKNWRGFHGLTDFNLESAWKLDYLLQLADSLDMQVHLVLDNHGKGSTWCDSEWEDNPYNAANGGPVEEVEDYFSNREAMRLYKKTLRYIIARWAHSPRLMGIEMWSELDLTGSSYSFVGNPVKTTWHREMAGYIKALDPWHHLVTTHYSTDYSRVDRKVVSLPEIDYVVGDAYRQKGSIIPLLLQTYKSCGVHNKPTFITEYGGSPWATTADQVIPLLKADLHAGMWASYMQPAAAIPLLWWFEFVDHQNQYFQFKALARFSEGEDRRGKNLNPGRVLVRAQPLYNLRLGAMGLKNKEMAYAWVYDRMAMEQWPAEGEEKRFSGVTAVVPNLKPGKYRVEIWNTKTGEIVSENELDSSSGGSLSIKLPEFETDCAIKIKYRD